MLEAQETSNNNSNSIATELAAFCIIPESVGAAVRVTGFGKKLSLSLKKYKMDLFCSNIQIKG